MAMVNTYLRDAHKLLESKNKALDMLYNEIEAMGDTDEAIDSGQYQDLKTEIEKYLNDCAFLQQLINLCNEYK
jgi:hypothetical protein